MSKLKIEEIPTFRTDINYWKRFQTEIELYNRTLVPKGIPLKYLKNQKSPNYYTALASIKYFQGLVNRYRL